jgi:arylsulfatase A-like enzyme
VLLALSTEGGGLPFLAFFNLGAGMVGVSMTLAILLWPTAVAADFFARLALERARAWWPADRWDLAPAFALVALTFVAVFSVLAERVAQAHFRNYQLAGLVLVIMALAALAGALLIVPILASLVRGGDRLLRRIVGALPQRFRRWFLPTLLLIPLVTRYVDDLSEVDLGAPGGALLLGALIFSFHRLLGMRPGWVRSWAHGVVLLGAALSFSAGAMSNVAWTHRAVSAMAASSWALPQIRGVLMSLTDFDGDGSSSLYGGGDWAPFDPDLYPFAQTEAEMPIPEALPQPIPTANLDELVGPQKPNMVFIVIDTLRADHTGHHGYPRATTPHLDGLASEGVVFERAWAPSTKTRYSLVGFLFGLPTSAVRLYVPDEPPREWAISRDEVSLATLLSKHGYRTHAVANCFRTFDDFFGLSLGFKAFDKRSACTPERQPVSKKARQTSDAAIEFFKVQSQAKEPFFLYLHYLDPHSPYKPPKTLEEFGDTELDQYDEILAWVDSHVGRVIDALDASGLKDNTVVVVTSDHGEEFGEHGGKRHGGKLYEELTHVPLVMRVPGQGPKRVKSLVGGFDLVPTILDLARVPGKAWPRLVGESLLPFLREEDPNRVIFSENGPYRRKERAMLAVRKGDMKLIFNPAKNALELFDLAKDPREKTNLAGSEHPAEKELTDWAISIKTRLKQIESAKEKRGEMVRDPSAEPPPKKKKRPAKKKAPPKKASPKKPSG